MCLTKPYFNDVMLLCDAWQIENSTVERRHLVGRDLVLQSSRFGLFIIEF